MNLMRIVDELNKQFFMNTINIDRVSIIKRADHPPEYETPSVDVQAFYAGDRCSGSIYLIAEKFHELSEPDLRDLLFHEMAHQLVTGHGPDFKLVMKRFTGPSAYELLAFAKILKENIELKSNEGKLIQREMFPLIAQSGILKEESAKARDSMLETLGLTLGGIVFISALILSILQVLETHQIWSFP